MNPGKLAVPQRDDRATVTELDTVSLRGIRSEQAMDGSEYEAMAKAFQRNGNAACLTRDATQTMCPAFKATNEKRHSPGRAALLCEWTLHKSAGPVDRHFEAKILVPDVLTFAFDAGVLTDAALLLRSLGLTVMLARPRPAGKRIM